LCYARYLLPKSSDRVLEGPKECPRAGRTTTGQLLRECSDSYLVLIVECIPA
jgi:hypothetical protein